MDSSDGLSYTPKREGPQATAEAVSSLQDRVKTLAQALNHNAAKCMEQLANQESHFLLVAAVLDDIVQELGALREHEDLRVVKAAKSDGKVIGVDWSEYYKAAKSTDLVDESFSPAPKHPSGAIIFGG